MEIVIRENIDLSHFTLQPLQDEEIGT